MVLNYDLFHIHVGPNSKYYFIYFCGLFNFTIIMLTILSVQICLFNHNLNHQNVIIETFQIK